MTETELVTWLSSTDEAPTTQSVTGSEIIDIVLNQIDNSDTESDEEGENVTYDEGIALGYKYLNFLPKQLHYRARTYDCAQIARKSLKKNLKYSNSRQLTPSSKKN